MIYSLRLYASPPDMRNVPGQSTWDVRGNSTTTAAAQQIASALYLVPPIATDVVLGLSFLPPQDTALDLDSLKIRSLITAVRNPPCSRKGAKRWGESAN
ncbi:hypothetical protein VTN77DRAFT_2434 [Rasamsonia byssochlamydoides]|uniref:uncharacterized protein n=1 Tax=Rasamsonia byssochlamydoides TaxID=89139 RepID=UPI0037433C86